MSSYEEGGENAAASERKGADHTMG